MNIKILKTIFCVVLFSLGLPSKVCSQDSLKTKLPEIVSFPEYITARMGLGNTSNSFGVIDENNNLEYSVSPNVELRTTFTLLYRSLEIDFGFAPSFLNTFDNSVVDSKLLVFNFRMYFEQWMQSLDFYNIKGFNLEDANFEVSENTAPLFENLKVLKIGGTTNYIFNKNFSFRAISFQNEWQRKSSGSFIPRISYYYTQFTDEADEKDRFYDITIGPSYFYNWIIAEHFIVSGGVKSGVGINIHTIENSNSLKDNSFAGINFSFGGRVSLGYNSKQFFTGLNANFDYFEHGTRQGIKIEDRQNLFEIYFGYRFKAPDKMNQAATWFNKKIGWD